MLTFGARTLKWGVGCHQRAHTPPKIVEIAMPGRQACILTPAVIRRVSIVISRRRSGARDIAMFLLSYRAGLRAAEIAQLDWSMLKTADGRLSSTIAVRDSIAKKGGGRTVPTHPELRAALQELFKRDRNGPVIRSLRTDGPLNPNSVVNWFVQLYAEIGAHGCSSHSGRRTFITQAARQAHFVGASLRDVQLLAGHRSIEVTQGYIDTDTQAQQRLIARL